MFAVVSVIPIADGARACSRPKPGSGWDTDRLISQADTIVLARLADIRSQEGSTGIEYVLVPVETLKGTSPPVITFHSYSRTHISDDFDGHRDPEFWKPGNGRSEWPCCLCGPDHTFVEGENYLVFPYAFGSMKSAEIIRSKDDKWYDYVRRHVQGISIRWSQQDD